MNPDDFAIKIKEKYPQYQSVDNTTLAQKMVEKYPQYADQVNFDTKSAAEKGKLFTSASKKVTAGAKEKFGEKSLAFAATAPARAVVGTGARVADFLSSGTQKFGSTIGQALGAKKATGQFTDALSKHSQVSNDLIARIRQKKAQGGDVSRLKEALQRHTANQPTQKRFTGDVIDKTAGQVIGEAAMTGLEALTGGLAKPAASTAKLAASTSKGLGLSKQAFKALPLSQKLAKVGVQTGKNVAQALPFGYAADVSLGLTGDRGEAREGAKAFIPGAGTALSVALPSAIGAGKLAAPTVTKATRGIGQAVSKGVSNVADPAKIMQRVARITKGKQQKFKKMAGEEVGEYLQKRGVYGTPEEISEQLMVRFQNSKNQADIALAELDKFGRHKTGALKDMIDEVVAREARVSSPNLPSPDSPRVLELSKAYKEGGLTMSEINEMKRLFERNVKLDYLRDNVSDKIARANNVDSAVRKWQFELADELGFSNLKAINRETRLARQLAEDIAKEYSGQKGNNAISLTDWVLLSGGEPTNVAAYFAKQTFGSKRIQSKIAKMRGGKATIPEVKAKVGAPRQFQLPEAQLSPLERQKQGLPSATTKGAKTIKLGERGAPVIGLGDEKGIVKSVDLFAGKTRAELAESIAEMRSLDEIAEQFDDVTGKFVPESVKKGIIEDIENELIMREVVLDAAEQAVEDNPIREALQGKDRFLFDKEGRLLELGDVNTKFRSQFMEDAIAQSGAEDSKDFFAKYLDFQASKARLADEKKAYKELSDKYKKITGYDSQAVIPTTTIKSNTKVIPTESTKAGEKASKEVEKLINEAKKYKSADEFVDKANTVNPSESGVFEKYTPEMRNKIPLGENIQTLNKSVGGNVDDIVTVYRGGQGNKINNGDFITTNKQLAKDYAGTGSVVELKVRKGDIIDMVDESGGEEYIYRVGADKEARYTKSQLIEIWKQANK